jgi:hypothetical protein
MDSPGCKNSSLSKKSRSLPNGEWSGDELLMLHSGIDVDVGVLLVMGIGHNGRVCQWIQRSVFLIAPMNVMSKMR